MSGAGPGDRTRDPIDAALDGVAAPAAPSPAAALEAALADLRPVAPRRPRRDLLGVTAASLIYAAGLVGVLSIRRDLLGVPVAWLVGFGAAWLAAFLGLAALALVPRRGAVMSRGPLAAGAAALVALGFVAAGLLLEPAAGAGTVRLDLARLHEGHTCLELGLATAIVPIVLGALLLRGALPVGARATAAALGAAGGSLGGLVLHLHCHIADRWHLGLVHGGVVVASALLAAALVPRVTSP
jgi:hypothetical protein